MLTPDQEKLKEAALAATAGEWRLRTHPRLGSFVEARTQSDMPYSLEILGDDYNGFGDDEQRDRDAAFVAAANPAAILAILAQLEQVQGADLGAEPAAQFKRNEQRNIRGMADCMDMVRDELIEMGIIGKHVPPMFIANAVGNYIKSLAAKSPLPPPPEAA